MKTPFPIRVSPERARELATLLPPGGIKGVRFRESKLPDPDRMQGEAKSSYLKLIDGHICLNDIPVALDLRVSGWSSQSVLEHDISFPFEIDGYRYALIQRPAQGVVDLLWYINGGEDTLYFVNVTALQVPKDHLILRALIPFTVPVTSTTLAMVDGRVHLDGVPVMLVIAGPGYEVTGKCEYPVSVDITVGETKFCLEQGFDERCTELFEYETGARDGFYHKIDSLTVPVDHQILQWLKPITA